MFAYKSPSPEALAADAVFGLDANVLLAPSQLGSASVANLETIYRSLADANRLFAPAQAVREYAKNRARKVADVYAQVYNRLSAIPTVSALDCPMLEGIAEYAALKELGSAIKEKAKEYKEKLTQLKQILADWGWNDKVSDLYRAIFTSARIVQHDLSKDEIKADLARRITHKLPPGYKDSGKKDEGVGDLIIWHSLIKLAKVTQKSVIFVCNEEKADWLVRSCDEPLMPRPELRHEFFQSTGKHFAMMSWPRFLKAMDASPTTVSQAEAEARKTSLIKAWLKGQTIQPPTDLSPDELAVLEPLRRIEERYRPEILRLISQRAAGKIPRHVGDMELMRSMEMELHVLRQKAEAKGYWYISRLAGQLRRDTVDFMRAESRKSRHS